MSDHEHKFFLFETKTTFEPTEHQFDGKILYERVEYGILVCNCSEVRKVKVSNNTEEQK